MRKKITQYPAYAVKSDDSKLKKPTKPISAYAVTSDDSKTKVSNYPAYAVKSDDSKLKDQKPISCLCRTCST